MGNACSSAAATTTFVGDDGGDERSHQQRHITSPSGGLPKHQSRRSSSIKSSSHHQTNGDSVASTLVSSSIRSLRDSNCGDCQLDSIVAVALRGASSAFTACPPVEPRKTIRASRPPHSTITTARDAFDEDEDDGADVREGDDERQSDLADFTAFPRGASDEPQDRSPSSNTNPQEDSFGWSAGGYSRRPTASQLPDNASSQDFERRSGTQSANTNHLDDGTETVASTASPSATEATARPHPPSTTQRGSFSGSDARSLMFSRNNSLRDVSLSIISTVLQHQQQQQQQCARKSISSDKSISQEKTASSSVSNIGGPSAAIPLPIVSPDAALSSTNGAQPPSTTSSSSVHKEQRGRSRVSSISDSSVLPRLTAVGSGTGSTRRSSFRRTPLRVPKIDASAFKSVTFMSSENSPGTPPIRSFGAIMGPSPKLITSSTSSKALLPPLSVSPRPPVAVAWRVTPSSPRMGARSEPLVRVAEMAEFGAMFFSAQAANTDMTSDTDNNDGTPTSPLLAQTQEYCPSDVRALAQHQEGLPHLAVPLVVNPRGGRRSPTPCVPTPPSDGADDADDSGDTAELTLQPLSPALVHSDVKLFGHFYNAGEGDTNVQATTHVGNCADDTTHHCPSHDGPGGASAGGLEQVHSLVAETTLPFLLAGSSSTSS